MKNCVIRLSLLVAVLGLAVATVVGRAGRMRRSQRRARTH